MLNPSLPIADAVRPSSDGQDRRLVWVQTFGCQMNVYDTDRMLQVLAPHGYGATDDPARADLILLNTCSVRDKAEHKMLSELGRLAPLKDHNDDLVLGVTGCVAQQEGENLLKKVPYLDLVLGPDNIPDLPRLVDRVRGEGERVSETVFAKRKDYTFLEATPPADGRVTDFVTIMKGCDKVCTYCIVPFTRGREVSKPRELVVREVEALVATGVREVTLLGQNVNSYGKDRNREVHFAELLRAVDAIEGLERVRFTTSHPMDCTDELIDCFAELPTLMEYFHLPVQSGSDAVLANMRRHYTVEHYMGRIERLRAVVPDIAMSTDIIVGFPGETEEDHQQTLELLRAVRCQNIFSFTYSERPGTRAATLVDDVPEPVKKRRLDEVQSLQKDITREIMDGYRDRTVEVLFEGPSKSAAKGEMGVWQMMGRTRSNLVVNVPVPAGDFWSNRWTGKLAHVHIEEVKANSLYGNLVQV